MDKTVRLHYPTAEQDRAAAMELHDILRRAFAEAAEECPLCGGALPEGYVPTNRDWLGSLTAAEFIGWIKNEAAEMSDAELMRWMEEKYE